ncbi:MAG: sodium/proton-translocating pyrophosphatase, partial [Gemmatirosa sp.]
MASSQSALLWLVLGISGAALVFAVFLSRWVLARDRGDAAMQRISNAIQEGAEAFLARQYKTIGLLSIVVAALIYIGYAFFRPAEQGADALPASTLALYTTLAFLLGAVCSGFAGFMGMWVSIRTNIRTASAARTSLNAALQTALRGGAVSGLFTVAMSLIGVAGMFWILDSFAPAGVSPEDWTRRIPFMIVGFGFGASFVALFAQLGGGIYTKAADVGA